jgi:hypothetical protein
VAITKIYIKNISGNSLSIDAALDDDRVIRALLRAGEQIDVSDIATLDELDRNAQLVALRSGTSPKISITEGALGDASLIDQSRFALEGQSIAIEQIAPSPMTVNFASLGLRDMRDDNYKIFLGGDLVSAGASVLSGSITAQGFVLVGGVPTDVHHILLVGAVV